MFFIYLLDHWTTSIELQQVYMYFRGSGKEAELKHEAARGALNSAFWWKSGSLIVASWLIGGNMMCQLRLGVLVHRCSSLICIIEIVHVSSLCPSVRPGQPLSGQSQVLVSISCHGVVGRETVYMYFHTVAYEWNFLVCPWLQPTVCSTSVCDAGWWMLLCCAATVCNSMAIPFLFVGVALSISVLYRPNGEKDKYSSFDGS
jgi:hypothetical protein